MADAGDFWCIQENIEVPDMEKRRPRKAGEKWGGAEGDARRILNLTDGSEKPLGQWNTMVIEARGRTVKVWVNGDLVNNGFNATADQGRSRSRPRAPRWSSASCRSVRWDIRTAGSRLKAHGVRLDQRRVLAHARTRAGLKGITLRRD